MPSTRDSRVVRLRDAATPAENYVRLAICTGCGHRDALPFDRLLRRFGALLRLPFHATVTSSEVARLRDGRPTENTDRTSRNPNL